MAPMAVETLGLARPLKPESSRTKPIMYRTTSPSPVAVKTDNIYVTFEDGSVVIDAVGGAGVSILGFGNQTVIQAVKDEMDRCGYVYAGLYSNAASEKLAAYLIDHSEGDFAGVNFVGGGSECIESCLKLAKQYWWERGNTIKRRFIGRKMSYHGNTIAALSLGWHPVRRVPFASFVNEDMFSWVSPAFYGHGARPGESEEDYATRLADELDAEITRLGPETVAAFVIEPMVATSIGAALPPKTYFTKIKAVCDEHDVLLIFDEIMCGMWRTGRMFTYWRIGEGVKPDLVATGGG
ncbi:hypothetical protein Q8F55_003268 [Vanrija albida]|uniref:Aspartate aminotransferase family protein n=1 Tax=Vanrija albida TaxID=181172 RepID=A0ABR3QC66_9TREE